MRELVLASIPTAVVIAMVMVMAMAGFLRRESWRATRNAYASAKRFFGWQHLQP